MTVTARTTDPSTTDSGDVRMRVRATGNGSVVPIRADMNPGTAYTRAIPREDPPAKNDKPGKIRNFVSQHAGEAKAAAAGGWLASESPQPLTTTLDQTIPARAEYPNPLQWAGALAARIFRLAVHTLAYIAYASTATDKRAAVAFALTLLTVATTLTASALAGH